MADLLSLSLSLREIDLLLIPAISDLCSLQGQAAPHQRTFARLLTLVSKTATQASTALEHTLAAQASKRSPELGRDDPPLTRL